MYVWLVGYLVACLVVRLVGWLVGLQTFRFNTVYIIKCVTVVYDTNNNKLIRKSNIIIMCRFLDSYLQYCITDIQNIRLRNGTWEITIYVTIIKY